MRKLVVLLSVIYLKTIAKHVKLQIVWLFFYRFRACLAQFGKILFLFNGRSLRKFSLLKIPVMYDDSWVPSL